MIKKALIENSNCLAIYYVSGRVTMIKKNDGCTQKGYLYNCICSGISYFSYLVTK